MTAIGGGREAAMKFVRANTAPRDEGFVQNGVRWFHAGMNASHAFYLGVGEEDGLVYQAASGPGCEERGCLRSCDECRRNSIAGSMRQVEVGAELYLGNKR